MNKYVEGFLLGLIGAIVLVGIGATIYMGALLYGLVRGFFREEKEDG